MVSDVSGLRGCRGIIFVYILCCIYIATVLPPHALARALPSVNLLVCTRSSYSDTEQEVLLHVGRSGLRLKRSLRSRPVQREKHDFIVVGPSFIKLHSTSK
jgi:hypothetical protein